MDPHPEARLSEIPKIMLREYQLDLFPVRCSNANIRDDTWIYLLGNGCIFRKRAI